MVLVQRSVLPGSAKMANALLQPATDQHAVASTAVVQAASALKRLAALDSVVLISLALPQPALLPLIVPQGRSALQELAVEVMFV